MANQDITPASFLQNIFNQYSVNKTRATKFGDIYTSRWVGIIKTLNEQFTDMDNMMRSLTFASLPDSLSKPGSSSKFTYDPSNILYSVNGFTNNYEKLTTNLDFAGTQIDVTNISSKSYDNQNRFEYDHLSIFDSVSRFTNNYEKLTSNLDFDRTQIDVTNISSKSYEDNNNFKYDKNIIFNSVDGFTHNYEKLTSNLDFAGTQIDVTNISSKSYENKNRFEYNHFIIFDSVNGFASSNRNMLNSMIAGFETNENDMLRIATTKNQIVFNNLNNGINNVSNTFYTFSNDSSSYMSSIKFGNPLYGLNRATFIPKLSYNDIKMNLGKNVPNSLKHLPGIPSMPSFSSEDTSDWDIVGRVDGHTEVFTIDGVDGSFNRVTGGDGCEIFRINSEGKDSSKPCSANKNGEDERKNAIAEQTEEIGRAKTDTN